MGATPHKAVTSHFPQVGENRISEAPGAVFDPTLGDESEETPPLKSLPQSTSRRSPPFFQKRLANKQMFKQHVKHHHQWSHSSIHFKTKSCQSSSDSVRIQGPSKRSSSGHLYPVSSVKEHNRKGGKCKISRVLQSPVSSPQASPKVEASNRPKQAQHLSTCRKVQNGNSRVHQDLPDSREWVSSIDLSDTYLHIPIHPNLRKYLRFCHRCSCSPLFHSAWPQPLRSLQ